MGLLSRRDVDRTFVGRAQSLLRHRGPDGSGSLHLVTKDARNLVLVNTRLAIIDRQEGVQPMWDAGKRWVVVFNGEIYNYIELRQELMSEGCHFLTSSDTESLVTAIAHWGVEKAVPRFNGMFAFAAFCPERNELVLARDRFGIKPLYIAERGEELWFSSEAGALIRMGIADARIDRAALELYLAQYSTPAPWSMVAGVTKLKPAHWLRVGGGGSREYSRYWTPRWTTEIHDRADAVEALDERMVASLRRHVRSDVPVGISLSGGLDSSSLLAYSTQELGLQPACYTLAFDESRWDESSLARRMAKDAHAPLTTIMARPADVLAEMRHVISRYGEPMGDWGVGLVGIVSRLAGGAHKVLLAGSGGDELFAGYPTINAHKYAKTYQRLPAGIRDVLKALVGVLPLSDEHMSIGFKCRRFLRGADEPPELAHLKYREIFSTEERRLLLGRHISHGHADVLAGIDLLDRPVHEERLLWIDVNTFMQSNVLAGFDSASMSHGTEIRVPFLDNEMYDFSLRLDPAIKFSWWTTKPLLRAAVRNRVPRSIRIAPKRGFTFPVNPWLRTELRATVDSLLSKPNLDAIGLNPDAVRAYWDEHKEGKRQRGRQMTAILSLVIWFQEFNACGLPEPVAIGGERGCECPGDRAI